MVFRDRQEDERPPVWGNVPPRHPNVTRWDEPAAELGKRLIARGTTAVLPSTLHGMGGIGKTQIATEYIYRHLTGYDVIWWIAGSRPTQVRASFVAEVKDLLVDTELDTVLSDPVGVRHAILPRDSYGLALIDQGSDTFPGRPPVGARVRRCELVRP